MPNKDKRKTRVREIMEKKEDKTKLTGESRGGCTVKVSTEKNTDAMN